MNPAPIFRKPKLHFDTAAFPHHVTFDDGRVVERNLPWCRFVEARWSYREPDVLQMEIGAWLIVIRGHHLRPLFAAIEDHTLIRVRAQPELSRDPDREADTFVTELTFTPAPTRALAGKRWEQIEFDLGDDPEA